MLYKEVFPFVCFGICLFLVYTPNPCSRRQLNSAGFFSSLLTSHDCVFYSPSAGSLSRLKSPRFEGSI